MTYQGDTGLRIVDDDKPVPLKSVDIEVDIKGFVANVAAVLVYKNPADDKVEVIYKFPIDEGSAVYRFEAEVDGRVIIAECQERKQAKQTYDEAVESGHTAALMEETESVSDIFSMKVGNIPGGSEVKITFGYVTELKLLAESGASRFTLCTVLNPRYNPHPQSGEVASHCKSNCIEEDMQRYDFSFKAKVGNSTPISNIVSERDELKVKYNADQTEAVVSLVRAFVEDHDLTLDVSVSDPFRPHVIIEKGVPTEEGLMKEDLVMLNFLPELKESDYSANHEFIIIIDRSGSMDGSKIKSAQETLLLFLKSLPLGCYFNIIGFGSNFDKLFPEGSKELSEESMKVALDYQQKLSANLGGTEIIQPLLNVYSTPVMSTHSRELFLLTDGEVGNTNEVISIVRKNALYTRVFTFGIGEGASTALVNGVARAGRGRAEYIREGERMQPIVMKTLKAAMQYGITDLQLDWKLEGSPNMIQIPKQLPPLFAGDRLIVYAVSTGQIVLDGKVPLKGKIGERELDFGLNIHSNEVKSSEDGTLPLHRLAAKSQILQLQDEKERSEENRAAVILLSTAANIISHHTAMVAVDKEKSAQVTGQRAVLDESNMKDSTVWLQCADSSDQASVQVSYTVSRKRRSTKSFAKCYFYYVGHDSGPSRSRTVKTVHRVVRNCNPVAVRQNAEVTADKVTSGYMAVVQLQIFSGSWRLDSDLERVLEVNLEKVQSSKPLEISDEVWATLLALAVLNTQHLDNKDEWEMIEMKAQQWLNTQQLQTHSLSSLLDLATAAVSNSKQLN